MGRRWPNVAGSFVAVIGLFCLPTTASAADPVTVSVSEVNATGGKVTGALTLRSKSSVQVDPKSLTVLIDGDEYPISIAQSARLDRRAMLVIDTSGSMDASGMATVRTATASYLKAVPADVLVGVVSFANTAGVDLAPTTDRAAVQKVVNGLASRGNTALYDGIIEASKILGSEGDPSILLLSDGADTVAPNDAVARRRANQALKEFGIRVDVVRFKSKDPNAAQALAGFASVNGGTVLSADNTAAVVTAFEASARALETQVPFEIDTNGAVRGSRTLEIAGVAGGSPFTVTRVVNFTTASAPATPRPTTTAAAPVALPAVPRTSAASWWPAVAALLVAMSLFSFAAVTLAPSVKTRRERRLESIEHYVVGPKTLSRSEGKPPSTPISEQLTAFGEKAMSGRKGTSWVLANIERADLPFRAGDWFVLTVASVAMGGVLGSIFFRGLPLIGIFLGSTAGLVLPQMALKFLADRRVKRFESILPDVMMLVATSLRSGFGLPQAIDAVARDAAEPAAKEFSRALAETRIGTDIADALEHASDRMGSKSLRWAVMAIRIQREVGGNLAETLLTTAGTLRERESLFRQVRALSAEGRISAYILILLPVALTLAMMAINYEYISLLWTTGAGLMMIFASLILFAVGIVWMRKLIRIEV